jgi:ankyrin repeat protein
LLKEGADVNKATDDGTTPLFMASQHGHCDVVEALLRGGADVNKAKNDGTTPLFMASQNGHCDVVEALLRGGADVNKANNDGATPLYIASEKGHCDVVEALVRAGADLTLAWRGRTPLRSATRKGHTDVVRVLQSAAAAGAGRLQHCAPRQQLVLPQPHVPVAQQAVNAVDVESPSHGLQRAERGAAATEPWADDARRCQLLLLDICESRSAEVGRRTREALQETARVLGQWIA